MLRSEQTAGELRYDHPFADDTKRDIYRIAAWHCGCRYARHERRVDRDCRSRTFCKRYLARNTALLFSTIFNPEKNVAFSLNYRHIPYQFQSPFGEISGTLATSLANLDGYYVGVELTPIPERLRVNAYAQFESELVPLGDLLRKQKYDYLADASYRATDAIDLKATVRDQENPSLVSDTMQTYITLPGQTLEYTLGSMPISPRRQFHIPNPIRTCLHFSDKPPIPDYPKKWAASL